MNEEIEAQIDYTYLSKSISHMPGKGKNKASL